MADDRLLIDAASVFNNADARAVEFAGEIDGERRDFALLYDVLEALDGAAPDADAAAAFGRHRDTIARAGTAALARGSDAERVTISENDLA